MMNPLIVIQSQLLATKFFVPIASGPLISRSHLTSLLAHSLKHPLTLLSAPAGFGKTTLLSSWAQSLPASQALVAWLSLDKEDNDLQLFWTYILSALDQQQPERFTPLFKLLQSPQAPSLPSILTSLINLALESPEHLVLILDDYHLISEQQVHTTLSYLIEHLPPQLHIILATRSDPPLPLSLLRTRRRLLEIRTNQLRCTTEETKAFLQRAMDIQLPDQTIQEVTNRTEGWLVGLQLLGLSLHGHSDSTTMLEEVSGDQRYILDYLTQVVLHQQPPEVQTFLLSTSILERLSDSLCDAVMQQTGSQQMLEYLERANLFIISLDGKRQWYRYHALFAQALYSQLEQTHGDLVPILHSHASHWYAQHHQTTAAILHAFSAHEWQWAADLIEQTYPSLVSFVWGVNRYTLVQLQQWIEQLPTEILASRPHLCLACVHLLWTITPHRLLYRWLDLAEGALRTSLKTQTFAEVPQGSLSPQGQQEQRDLLGEILTARAHIDTYTADGQTAFALYEQALALLSPENAAFRALVALGKEITYYTSSANNTMAAIECGYQAVLLAQEAKQPAVACAMMASTAIYLIGAGHLHETEQVAQTFLQETSSGDPQLPEIGWIMVVQAEILRERNQLAPAYALATEAITLCERSISPVSLLYLYWGYAILIRVCLSCGDLDASGTFLQQAEKIGKSMNQQAYEHQHSCFTTIDQVRIWLACDKRDQAIHWAQQLEIKPQSLTPFAHERQEVALARILLVKNQPTAALQRLEPVLQRATAGQRWGHVIEIRLLQALAHQMLHEQSQALVGLSEAIRLAEPEGYIRTFIEEGAPMADLLSKLREEQRQTGSTPYLDTLLAAFAKESKKRRPSSKMRRHKR